MYKFGLYVTFIVVNTHNNVSMFICFIMNFFSLVKLIGNNRNLIFFNMMDLIKIVRIFGDEDEKKYQVIEFKWLMSFPITKCSEESRVLFLMKTIFNETLLISWLNSEY
jgi:hypothetical protein